MFWSVFKKSAASLNENATTVTDFIRKCVETCVPKKILRVFPNEKTWMNRDIHCLLRSRSEAFNSGRYKKARYDLHRSIEDVKKPIPDHAVDQS